LSNQIDMCAECIDSRVFARQRKFVHHPSHSLVRSSRRIHYCQIATMIPQARLRSERIKASFKASAVPKHPQNIDKVWRATDNVVTSRPIIMSLACACCGQDLTLPCWACVTCAIDTLICLECERKKKLVPKSDKAPSAHSLHHPLLRINQIEEIKLETSELKATRLETQLTDMEARINSGLSGLEQKVNLQLEEMKAAVDDVGKKFGQLNQPVNGTSPNFEQGLAHGPYDVSADEVKQDTVELENTEEEFMHDDRTTPKLHQRLDRLESQFGVLMSLVQDLVSATRSSPQVANA